MEDRQNINRVRISVVTMKDQIVLQARYAGDGSCAGAAKAA
ncbi:MAG: hypothetical protein QM533_12025 [Cytophagales bacterium]|nr:hypothetical protein [Cytophagales bacterium]